MKKLMIAALVTLALGACGQQDQPAAPPVVDQSAGTEPADAGAEARDTTAAVTPRALPAPLAEGVVFSFPYHFRTSRIDATASGFSEEFSVEYLEADTSRVATRLITDMSKAGFEVQQDQTNNNRRLIVFGKKDFGRVRARFAPADGRNLFHPKAGGTLTMVWPSAGPATAAAEAEG